MLTILDNVDINTPAGLRNKAILELLWATGMRVSELSGLNFEDLELDENEITVFGKGAKERIVLVSERAKKYLLQYINVARPLVAKNTKIETTSKSPVFINKTGFRLQNKTIRNIEVLVPEMTSKTKANMKSALNNHLNFPVGKQT